MTPESPAARAHRIVVIGAGALGSAIAARAAEHGDSVTLLRADGAEGSATSRASFAWVNAHGKVPEGYRLLNAEGRARHTALSSAHPSPWFVRTGAEIDGVVHPDDGYVDAQAFVAAQLDDLRAAGGTVIDGPRASSLNAVRREYGPIDTIIVAAGVATATLVARDGRRIDRLRTTTGSDGFLVRIAVDRHPIDRIRSIAGLQVRPDGPGRVAAQSLSIEADLARRGATASVETVWPALRSEIEDALGWVVPDGAEVRLDRAPRPHAADGLPVIGRVAHDVYVAVAHSGMTLASLIAELVARDVHGDADPRLQAYRPAPDDWMTP